MIKIRIKNADHEIVVQFPISENELYAKLAAIHAIEGKDAPQSAFVTEVYMLTIFGYSAPSSDKKAVSLLKKAWGDLEDRDLEEVSVIDIIDEDAMLKKWSAFIYTHHYRYTNDFYNSYLGMFPRRTCETIFATFQLNVWADNQKGFKPGMSWDEVKDKISPLIKEELETPEGENYSLYYSAC